MQHCTKELDLLLGVFVTTFAQALLLGKGSGSVWIF